MSPLRERRVTLLLSEEEYGKLEELVENRGVTASDVIRLLIQKDWEFSHHLSPLERDSALAQAGKEARLAGIVRGVTGARKPVKKK
jgi:hypothetical protein